MNYLKYLKHLPRSPKGIRTRNEWDEQYPGVSDPVLCGATGVERIGSHGAPWIPTTHVQGCRDCLKLLKEIDFEAFKYMVISGVSSSRRKKACVEMLPYVDGGVVSIIKPASSTVVDSPKLTVYNCISDEQKLISILPSLDIKKMQNAPNYPGIYFVVANIENACSVLYIGKAQNIKKRWKNHHRFPELDLLTRVGIKIQVYFLIIPFPIGSDEHLVKLESHYIDALQPKLNCKRVSDIGQKSVS
jgi:hypothetical protein